MQKRHRIFIAINLPGDVRKVLARVQEKLPELPAKWTDVENLHITLVFLGDITDEQLGQVCLDVKKVAENHETFNIVLQKIAYGPEGKIPPRYIWAGGEGSKEAVSLKDDLEDVLLESVKFSPDTKAFTPHITLARIQEWAWRAIEPEERPDVEQDIIMEFSVESIEVMESELKKGGPQYTIIESYNLT